MNVQTRLTFMMLYYRFQLPVDDAELQFYDDSLKCGSIDLSFWLQQLWEHDGGSLPRLLWRKVGRKHGMKKYDEEEAMKTEQSEN